MKSIILINGLIASGKNTVGKTLSKTLEEKGYKSSFFDVDGEVTRLNPTGLWKSEEHKNEIWLQARKNLAFAAQEELKMKDYVVIAGPFFLPKEITGFLKYVHPQIKTFLFTLETSLDVRLERNKYRTPTNDPKEIMDQEELYHQLKPDLYGYIIQNTAGLDETIQVILTLLSQDTLVPLTYGDIEEME